MPLPGFLQPGGLDFTLTIRRSLFPAGAAAIFVTAALVSQFFFFVDGRSTFHFNSVGSSLLAVMSIFLDHISQGDFMPRLWASLFAGGVFINNGLSYFNPLLIPAALFGHFDQALIFYDIQMKVLGSWGLYLLLRRGGLLKSSSLIGATLFCFNGVLASFSQDPQIVYGMCLLPWVFLGIERVLKNPNLREAAILSVPVTLLFLASTIQAYGFLITIAIAPYAAFRIFVGGRPFGSAILYLLAGGLLHVASISFSLIPQLYDLLVSAREAQATNFGAEMLFTSVLAFLVGGAILFAHSRDRFLLRVATSTLIFFALYLSIVFVTEESGFLGLLRYLFFDLYNLELGPKDFVFGLRLPRYVFTGPQLFLIVLATLGVSRPFTRSPIIESQIAATGGYFIVLVYPVLVGSLFSPEDVRYWIPYIERSLIAGQVGIIVMAAVGLDFCVRRLNVLWKDRAAWKPVSGALIGMALLVDAGTAFFHGTLFTGSLKYTRDTTAETRFLGSLGPTDRVFGVYEDDHEAEVPPALQPGREAFLRWLFPVYFGVPTFSNVGVPVFIKSLADYDNLLGGYDKYGNLLLGYGKYGLARGSPVTPFVDMAGINYILSAYPLDHPSLSLVLKGKDTYIYRNRTAWPRVYLFADVISGREEQILDDFKRQLVGSGSSDLEDTARILTRDLPVFRETMERFGGGAGSAGSGTGDVGEDPDFVGDEGTLKIVAYQDEYVKIDGHLARDALLMLSDVYYPG